MRPPIAAATFAMTVRGGPAGGMAMSLDGVLSEGARCQFRPTTDGGGRLRLDMPECSFSMKGEHVNHGSISKWRERTSNSGVRHSSLTPLVVASGHAIPRDRGAHFVAETQLEFVRTSGGPTPVSRRVGFKDVCTVPGTRVTRSPTARPDARRMNRLLLCLAPYVRRSTP